MRPKHQRGKGVDAYSKPQQKISVESQNRNGNAASE